MGLPATSLAPAARTTLCLVVFVALMLVGCGPVKRINPPAATVQRLTVAPGGNLALDVRLQNHSDVETRFGRLAATVVLDGIEVGRIDQPLDVDVAPHSVEVVAVQLSPSAQASSRLQPALAAGQSLRYRLDGEIVTTEPDGDYPLEYESRLSPVPGRPGEYR